MKTLIIISMLMLTCCTREYFVFVYVQPEKKGPAFGELILPTYRKDCADPGCCVLHYDNQLIDTSSFIFRLNRGDFMYKTDSTLFSKP